MIRTDLEPWQKLNVASFLASGIAAAFPECIGEPCADGSGTPCLSLIGQPILIYGADRAGLSRARTLASARFPKFAGPSQQHLLANFGKSWALGSKMISSTDYRSEVPERICRLCCRDFRSAVLGDVRPAVYTEDMFRTTHDAANREAVRAVARADLNQVGIAMRAERKVID